MTATRRYATGGPRSNSELQALTDAAVAAP